jgi:hypothetical protein
VASFCTLDFIHHHHKNDDILFIFLLVPLGTAATNRPMVPAPVVYDDGEIGGMIDRGNRSNLRKPGPVPV